jgi:hypothetical protein
MSEASDGKASRSDDPKTVEAEAGIQAQAESLARSLGITVAQARRHLREFPLETK